MKGGRSLSSTEACGKAFQRLSLLKHPRLGVSGSWTHLVGDRVFTVEGPVDQGVRQDRLHEQQQRPAVVTQAQEHGFTAAAEGAFDPCDSQCSLQRD